MSETITLRGYAVPFGQTACVDNGDKLEQFESGAFTAMLAQQQPGKKIKLRWDSHSDGAIEFAGSLSLFADDYGLRFSATLNAREFGCGFLSAMTQRKDPKSFCSVGGLTIESSRHERLQMGTTEIVTRATIDHITICAKPSYRGTGCWPDHLPLDDAPLRIQKLDARWSAGRAAFIRGWLEREELEARLVASSRAIGRTVAGHFVMAAQNGALWTRHKLTGRRL